MSKTKPAPGSRGQRREAPVEVALAEVEQARQEVVKQDLADHAPPLVVACLAFLAGELAPTWTLPALPAWPYWYAKHPTVPEPISASIKSAAERGRKMRPVDFTDEDSTLLWPEAELAHLPQHLGKPWVITRIPELPGDGDDDRKHDPKLHQAARLGALQEAYLQLTSLNKRESQPNNGRLRYRLAAACRAEMAQLLTEMGFQVEGVR